ncbi:MAG: hypothetical protein ACKO96_21010, partial [Flammeovirgaceae bacterium]
MVKNILVSYLIIILLFGFTSPYVIWESVDKGGLEQCPQASNLNSTKPIYLGNQSLPLTLYTPAQNATWCKKVIPGCGGYSPCSQTFITNYSQSMIGFNIDFIWHHSEPQSCLGNDNHWAIFYNKEACYSGGVEYGIVYFVCKKKLAFYYSIDSNWKTQKWVDKPISYIPFEGKNYLRVKLEMVGAPITDTQ